MATEVVDRTTDIPLVEAVVEKFQYPGIPTTCDGAEAVVWVETRISQGCGAFPITSSTTMGGGFNQAVVNGVPNLWGDQLVFVGVVDSVVELQRIRGLIPATNQVFKLHGRRAGRTLIEAVVSDTCPLLGKTIREGRFRTQYNAVVIAAARHGERLHQKIGDIVLQTGDTLLLEARPSFVQQQRTRAHAGDPGGIDGHLGDPLDQLRVGHLAAGAHAARQDNALHVSALVTPRRRLSAA